MKKRLIGVEVNSLSREELKDYLLSEATALKELLDPACERIENIRKVVDATVAEDQDFDWDLWDLGAKLNDVVHHIRDIIECMEEI